MTKPAISFSKNDDYYTPLATITYFGPFDYDPATTPAKAAEFGIPAYDTISTNGLAQDWTPYARIWINPPFTLKNEFLQKAITTYTTTKADIYILLPISFLTTKKFHDLFSTVAANIYLPSGRLNFASTTTTTSPAFGSVILKLQDAWELTPVDRSELM